MQRPLTGIQLYLLACHRELNPMRSDLRQNLLTGMKGIGGIRKTPELKPSSAFSKDKTPLQ